MAEKTYKEIVENKRQEMLNALVESMEKDPGAWQKGWFTLNELPQNGLTQKQYRGLNALFLYGAAKKHGYDDPRWVTFNQAHELGATIKQGEKSSSVFFYREYDKATKRDFDPSTIATLSKDEQLAYREENVRKVLKHSAVFNAAQCENFPAREIQVMSEEEQRKQDKRINAIMQNSEAPIFDDGGNRAYYNRATDSIHLPKLSSFKSLNDFYATMLHEVAHSTGHETRLARDLSGEFGSQKYALEELRAELSSVFMQVDLGINLAGAEVKNHAAYCHSWLTAIRDDPMAFYKAVTDADKICKYISTKYLKNEIENTKEVKEVERSIDTAKPKFYDEYLAAEKQYPNSVVVQRMGDFYEVMGANAAKVAEALDLTLTGRDVGLPERVSMCGFPYHVADNYFQKLSETSSLVVIENGKLRTIAKSEKENTRENLTAKSQNFTLEFNLNYSNELLLSNELKKLGFTLDKQMLALNSERDGQFMQQGKQLWVDEIRYLGENGKELSGFYGKTFNGIMAQNLQITGFTALGLSREEVEAVAKAIRDFDVEVSIKPHETKEVSRENTRENEAAERATQPEVVVAVGSAATAPITAELVSEPKEGRKATAAWVAAKREKRYGDLEKNVPQGMKDLPNWCAFSSSKNEDGKYTKKIWNCNNADGTKSWAKCNDPSTWTTFSKALEYARNNGCDGLSFALTPESGVFCIDLDGCKVDGKYSPLAWGVYNSAKGTYVERSVSGNGLHLFGEKAPGVDFTALGNKSADDKLEFYDRDRFMSMTGDIFMKSKAELKTFSDTDKLLVGVKEQLPVKTAMKPVTAYHNNASDNEVIERIRKSKKGAEFDRLFAGEDIQGNRNRSDMKLLNILAFFTNGDAEQMRRIFEQSGLMRTDKARGYLDHSIRKALGTLHALPQNLSSSKPTVPNGGGAIGQMTLL